MGSNNFGPSTTLYNVCRQVRRGGGGGDDIPAIISRLPLVGEGSLDIPSLIITQDRRKEGRCRGEHPGYLRLPLSPRQLGARGGRVPWVSVCRPGEHAGRPSRDSINGSN